MMTKASIFWWGLAMLAGWSEAQVIEIPTQNVSSSSEIGGAFNRQDDFLVDGSGLSNGRHTAAVQPNMWLSTGTNFGGVDPDPFVIFDLGQVYTISAIHVWNYNESPPNLTGRGVNAVKIQYGTTAALGSEVPGITAFAEASGSNSYEGQRFDAFAPFAARFIKFDIDSNHGGDNQFYGLSEVRFEGTVSSIELEPGEFLSSAPQGAPVGVLTTVTGQPDDALDYSLVAGEGDADNGKFSVQDGELQVGDFDFSGLSNNETFSVRLRAVGSVSGQVVERVLEIIARADRDRDALADEWEIRWAGAGNPEVLSGLGDADADGDGLSDLQEYQLRDLYPELDPTAADSDGDGLSDGSELAGAGDRPVTNPTLADTDGDGLNDRVESNTGIFVGPQDTGTDPTNPDSDGDTLSDGVESGSGIFAGPTDTGTNPNEVDSDGDGVNDNVEVERGSDPNDATSLPPVPEVGLNRGASNPDSVVVFNEIHYHPRGEDGGAEWIELFNQMGIRTDVSGWRIDGVGYLFPEGTFIEAGGYLVVARNPGPGELGPFPGRLSNGGERLRLINRGDRLMDELTYDDDGRWPVEADGSGCSLAKRHPYTANEPPENWRFSAQVGGTRGAPNFPEDPEPDGLVINELPSAGALNFWIELGNAGGSPVDLAGLVLSVNAEPERHYLIESGSLAPGGVLLLEEAVLGFRALEGERIFLSRGSRVFDGRRLTGRNRGRAREREGAWLYPSVPTPNEANRFSFQEDIVISEIAYNPPAILPEGRDSENQWVELTNRGSGEVDLGGWFFDDGFDLEFPPGTVLAPGEQACVVRDATLFSAEFPGARFLGVFDGRLSRGGERLRLCDAAGNPVDVVRYFDGGRWPGAADGGGSTLELRDLQADNGVPEAWAASDERYQTEWQTYRYRKVARSNGDPTLWREFNMGLLGSGEMLLDDLSVIEDPDGGGTEMLANGDFENGTDSWRLRGNHRHSEVIPDPGDPSNQVLRVVASGVTEHMHNQIETTLANGERVVDGREYEISFKARWVTGTPHFLTRLYLARSARSNLLARPLAVGTPSAPNSRAEVNIGPTVAAMKHDPAVPLAGETISVTARAQDPDGITGLTLRYSVNGGAFQSRSMNWLGDGQYEGSIPGQSSGAVVQFYLELFDGAGGISVFPADGTGSRALIKIDDGLAATNGLHNFRIVMTDADRDLMHRNTEVMSNDRFRATIIDREEEIYYDAKVRLKGSQRARAYQPRVGYNLRFGSDQPYRGVHQSMAIDRSEGTGSGQFELLFDLMMANSGGVISRYYDLIQVITPTGATHTRPAILQMARYNDVFLDSQFEDGSDGNLFDYDFVYYPQQTDGQGNKVPQGDGIASLAIQDHGVDKERYRFYLSKKNNRDGDDFGPIIRYCQQMSKSGADFDATLDEVVDVDSWLRGMAYAVLSGAGDNTGAGTLHNGMYYERPDGRIIYFPHDMDFAFSNTRSIFANGEVSRMANRSSTPGNEARRRIYYGHLHDIISTTWNADYMGPWQDHLGELSPNQDWQTPNSGSYSIAGRAANVLSQISGQIPERDFEIETPSPLVVNTSRATVSGRGWINVREIRLAGSGEPLPLTWTDRDAWQVSFPVRPGLASYRLQAFDFSGMLVGSEALAIENTSAVEPASRNNLVVSELMYHPGPPSAAEFADGFTDDDRFEFIELMNVGTRLVDLDGVAFTDGIDHDLPAVLLEPGERVVLARDRAGFLRRYPGAVDFLLPGEYFLEGDRNRFSNNGEEVVLSDAFGFVIRSFTYDDDRPWPLEADGGGESLTLVAPESRPDHKLPQSWRASLAKGGSPGTSDALLFTGDPDRDDDGDGLSALLEFAMGTSDSEKNAGPGVAIDPSGHLLFSFTQRPGADGVILEAQHSPDLENWRSLAGNYQLVGDAPDGSGNRLLTWRSLTPATTGSPEFLRLRARFR